MPLPAIVNQPTITPTSTTMHPITMNMPRTSYRRVVSKAPSSQLRRCPSRSMASRLSRTRQPGERLSEQADPLGELHRLCAVAGPELPIQRTRVLLDGVRREEQPIGDLAVGGAGGDQVQHLALALGEERRRLLGLAREHRHPESDH